MSVHTEIERKFDVEAPFALPDLAALPGVARLDGPHILNLEATYFDTPDLRLATHRRTLRHRLGGDDAGWHLKVPADGERSEIRHPPGEPGSVQVPDVLLPHLAALTRGQPLAPIARLSTRRTVHHLRAADGRELVEIAEDDVHGQTFGPGARALHWCEVEVELIEADLALLAAVGERLVAAGARPSPSPSKLARLLGPRLPEPASERPASGKRRSAGAVVGAYLRDQLDALLGADVRLRLGDAEGVHDVRVAARRLRSALQAYGVLFDPAPTGDLVGRLRELGLQLSPARDREVLLAHLRAQLDALPAELVLGPVRARLEEDLLPAELNTAAHAAATLDSPEYFRLLDDLEGFVRSAPFTAEAGKPAARALARLLRRAERRVARRVAALEASEAPGEARDQALHAVRKAAKRARYAAEVARPVLGRSASRAALRYSRVQELLGTRQDSAVAGSLLRRLGAASTGADENGFTFGLLYGLELARAERAEREFWALWNGTP